MDIDFYDETGEDPESDIASRVWEAVPRVGEDVSLWIDGIQIVGRVTRVAWTENQKADWNMIQPRNAAAVILDTSLVGRE